jgi:hypothetical protein
MTLSLPLPLAGAYVPTVLPVQDLGMQGHRAQPHHCTWRHHRPVWHCPCHLRQLVHIYTNFHAALDGLLVPALPNMKTMPVAFILPLSSWTCCCFHIQCCQRPSLCRTARCNQGNGRTFIVASGRPLSAMAVTRGILVACCARPQGTDAVACWRH